MSSVWSRTLALLSVLLLAGCFQQAGESLQSGGNVPLNAPNATPDIVLTIDASPTTVDINTPDSSDASPAVIITIDTTATDSLFGPASATIPPITIIAPTSTSAVAPTATPNISNETPTQETGSFITPGFALGPDVTVTTPTPASGNPTSTPSGLITPTALDINNPDVAAEPNADDACTYEVEPGDTVYRIAIANDTTVDAMREANPDLTGENPVIHPGDLLRIPDCEAGTAPEPTEDGAFGITAIPSPAGPIISPAGQTATPVLAGQTYTVERGDTLFTIAQRFGVTMASIVEANELDDPDRLSVGQELVIPPSSP